MALELKDRVPRLLVVVGSGGVGKTTLAASFARRLAKEGEDTLVMTFDPSHRLRDAMGVGDEARDREIEVSSETPGRLSASLLDARKTFDRLVARYAPDEAARRRILENRFYRHLGGSLAGILEYMAVERLFEVSRREDLERIVLDTPPTSQALDFLEAPHRIVSFLDSGAIRLALRPWLDSEGRLLLPRSVERRLKRYLDELVGLDLLRDMAEFFHAFAPLFKGFRERASQVEELLASSATLFLLVVGPGEQRVADALFFARRLVDAGYSLGPVVVNRLHPAGDEGAPEAPSSVRGDELIRWLGQREADGVANLRELMRGQHPVVTLPLLRREPVAPADLDELGRRFAESLEAALAP